MNQWVDVILPFDLCLILFHFLLLVHKPQVSPEEKVISRKRRDFRREKATFLFPKFRCFFSKTRIAWIIGSAFFGSVVDDAKLICCCCWVGDVDLPLFFNVNCCWRSVTDGILFGLFWFGFYSRRIFNSIVWRRRRWSERKRQKLYGYKSHLLSFLLWTMKSYSKDWIRTPIDEKRNVVVHWFHHLHHNFNSFK